MSIRRVLVANRGEIALRVFRTCRRLGINTVAVYSRVDAGAPHVRRADRAAFLAGETVEETYLDIEQIIAAAKRYGADAVHPGYGFLSENADFAAAAAAAGLTFIGPTPEVLRTLGRKDSARDAAVQCGVPVVPGLALSSVPQSQRAKRAAQLGFPLMIKAAGGGGGRGMRRVDAADELEAALAAAEREAKSSFKDPALLLEKIVEPARHIEVQLIADNHGNVLHLFERDCSLQRRFQKVIEETPARALSPELRQTLCDAAVAIGRHVKLSGAATVEFLVAGPADGADGKSDFHFLEVNPRLQVEHPVTEMVTGLDLVELQLIAAANQPLPLRQQDIVCRGAAVEARVCAEIAQKGFMPAGGTLRLLSLPSQKDMSRPSLRIEHALAQGLEITPRFDPMLMKVIAWGETDKDAWRSLQQALGHTVLVGVETNISFLLALAEETLRDPQPQATTSIERNRALLCAPERYAEPVSIAAAIAALAELQLNYPSAGPGGRYTVAAVDELDPFLTNLHWRGLSSRPLLDEVSSQFELSAATIAEVQLREVAIVRVERTPTGERYLAEVRGAGAMEIAVLKRDKAHGLPELITCNSEQHRCTVLTPRRNAYGRFEGLIYLAGHLLTCTPIPGWEDPEAKSAALSTVVSSPLPGTVLEVRVAPGASVSAGEPLVVIESMKTEHVLSAPRDAKVLELRVKKGEAVAAGQVLAVFG